MGLDPDEPEFFDPEQFSKLSWFLDKECDDSEQEDILSKCIPCMAKYALKLKEFKPPGGVHFSLQQQGTQYEFNFCKWEKYSWKLWINHIKFIFE